MTQLGSLLLIGHEPAWCAALAQSLTGRAVVRRCREVDHALGVMGRVRWSGMIVDLTPLAGEPLAMLDRLRAEEPIAPVLALASALSAELVNGAQALRVELVARPVSMSCVLGFVERALASRGLSSDRVAAWVRALSTLRSLDLRERDLFGLALGAETEAQVLARWGVSEDVLHDHIRSLLRKCQARNLDTLAKQVLLQARAYGGDPASAASILHGTAADEDELGREAKEAF